MADPISRTQSSPGFLRSLYDGAIGGDFSSNQSGTKTASQIGTGLIPIVGQIADARDTLAAVKDVRNGRHGGWGNLGFAVVGWIPAAGDFLKSSRRIGVQATLDGIRQAAASVKRTWSQLWKSTDERVGEVGALMYRPGTRLASDTVPEGALGVTNRFGDIQIREGLDAAMQQSTLDHESVHRFLSPKALPGQEFRANLGLLGYLESHLLRRTEEGLAEAWAKFRKDGLSGIREGWRFPYEGGYSIDPERVKIERNLLLGASVSTIAAGNAVGDALRQE